MSLADYIHVVAGSANYLADIAAQVRMHRKAAGLTQRQLAAAIGTSSSALSRLESGRHRPSIPTLVKITRALDCQVTFTVGRPLAGGDGAAP